MPSLHDLTLARPVSQAEYLELPADRLVSVRDRRNALTLAEVHAEIRSRIGFDERCEITALTIVLYGEFLEVPDVVWCCIGTETCSGKPTVICCENPSADGLKSISTVVLFEQCPIHLERSYCT